MKRIALVIAAAAVALPALAQNVEVQKMKCEPKPEYPGRLALQSETQRKRFDREVKSYKDCVTAYLEQRKAGIKANQEAADAAVEEHNAVMKKIQEEQSAASK